MSLRLCPCPRVRQIKKKAIELRAILELIMIKVGMLRDLVNDLTKFKLDATYDDEELSEKSLERVETSLTAFIHVLTRLPAVLSCFMCVSVMRRQSLT
jgi:hypothetical protein